MTRKDFPKQCIFESALLLLSHITFWFLFLRKEEPYNEDITTVNPITPSVHDMVVHTSKILQQIMEDS